MRIQFLASTLVRGGAETMACALADGLARRGHEVSWTLLREPGALGEAVELPLRSGIAPERFPVTRIGALARCLRGSEALYTLDHQNAAVLAALAMKRAPVPRRVVAVHTTGRMGGRPSLPWAFRRVLPAYDAVLALSPRHAAYLAEQEAVPREQIEIVPNGIPLEKYAALPSRREARERLGIHPEAPVIGCVAMLRPEKNHRLLLDVLARIGNSGYRPVLVLVGDGPEASTLLARTAELGLTDTVRFLGRRDDVPELLPAFDALALTSHPAVETQPVAVLEAMAAGVPVVATDVGDVSGVLDGGKAGLLVPPGDGEAFAAALGSIWGDLETTHRRVAHAREHVRTFDLERSIDRLENVLGVTA